MLDPARWEAVLDKVVEYFHYWYRNRDREDVPDMEIPVEMCLELLMAANFFNLDGLGDNLSALILTGVRNTLGYTVVAFGGGLVLAFGLALMKLSPVLPDVAACFPEVARLWRHSLLTEEERVVRAFGTPAEIAAHPEVTGVQLVKLPPRGAAQMLWANMALHMAADPQALVVCNAAKHEAIVMQAVSATGQ